MDAVPAPVEEVVVAELDGEIALLLPDSGETLLLNPSATQIWLECDGVQSVPSVIAGLAERFPDVVELARQVEATVEDLVRRGFLVWRDDRPAPREHPLARPT